MKPSEESDATAAIVSTGIVSLPDIVPVVAEKSQQWKSTVTGSGRDFVSSNPHSLKQPQLLLFLP